MKRNHPFKDQHTSKKITSKGLAHASTPSTSNPGQNVSKKMQGAGHVTKSGRRTPVQRDSKKKKGAAHTSNTSHNITDQNDSKKNENPAPIGASAENAPVGPKSLPVSRYTDTVQSSLVNIAQYIRDINAYSKLPKKTKEKTYKTQISNVETQLRLFMGVVTKSVPDILLADKQEKEDLFEIMNDTLLDRANLYMDMMEGLIAPDSMDVRPASIRIPKIRSVVTRDGPMDLCKIKPQDEYKAIKVDNSPDVFTPKLTYKENSIVPFTLNPIYEDEIHIGFENPYLSEINAFKSQDYCSPAKKQVKPPPVDVSKVTMVSDADQLKELLEHLETVPVFAVDLEHHNFRSYLGLTCLMQITTETGGDFIVDVFKVWDSMHLLNRVFTRQNIVKVFHGAKSDIQWLQRDFNIYVVGMFDTYEAARILKMQHLSLAHLLSHYCQINTDKRYQLYDWRIRPLPEEVLKYAISDTHYLLYIYNEMAKELVDRAEGQNTLYELAFENSKITASFAYKKPLPVEVNFNKKVLEIFTPQQKLVWYKLLIWRDQLARKLDESTMYIMNMVNMKKLITRMAREVKDVCRCLDGMDKKHPVFKRENLEDLLNVMCYNPNDYLEALEAAGLNEKPKNKTEEEYWSPHDNSGENVESDEVPLLMLPPEPRILSRPLSPDPAFLALKEVFGITHNFLSPYERYMKYKAMNADNEENQ